MNFLRGLIRALTGPMRLRDAQERVRQILYLNAQLRRIYLDEPISERRIYRLSRLRREERSCKNALARLRRLEQGEAPFFTPPK